MNDAALHLAVLLSGSGSNLQALIDAIEGQQLTDTEIALVVSNKADAYGVQRALQHRLPTVYLPWKDRAESEARLTVLLNLFRVDLIVCVGWMRIFSSSFVEQFPRRMINLHPALLPDSGIGNMYSTSDGEHIPVFRGLHVVRQALEADVKTTGSTLHYVTPEVDAGPVICRAEVKIQQGDTEETLHERIKAVEHGLVVVGVRRWREETKGF